MQDSTTSVAAQAGQRWRGAMAHELNNVLGVIRGNTELVLADSDDPSLVQTCAQDILQACDTLTQLSWCLQATGRRILFRPEPTPVAAWSRSLTHDTDQHRFPPLAVELEPDVPNTVDIDGDQLRTALQHVMADGRSAGATTARLHLSRAEDSLVLTFEDDRRHAPGTIGPRGELTLSAFTAVVESIGGSPVRTGWTPNRWNLHTRFPLGGAAAPRPTPSARPAQPRVLVVDDEPAVGRMVQRVLERAGHIVEVFADPIDALDRLRAHPSDFDVALLDIMMPSLTGPELLSAMRRSGIEVPVVFMTGAAPADTEVFDARSVLSKPFTHLQLLDALDRAHGS